jgi:alcohol dehydrogenase class IV
MTVFNAARVPPLTFGAGRLVEAPQIITGLGGGPVLIVADAILEDLGVTARLAMALENAGICVEIAADIAGEPKDALVDALVARARKAGCASVIGLGGGAAMDAAKLVAAVAGGDKPALHYALGANPYPAARLPAVAVPTTAGTGSEVTRTSIVSTKAGHKYWYWGEELLFSHAILDPELTISLPPHLTAWTGIDAVAHALEASTSRSSSPVGRLFGLQALEVLARSLPCAVADGADLEARSDVLWGSTLAGLALHNCNTHMGHNISHALGSLAPVHHGLATGLALEITLPALASRPEGAENYAAVSAAMGGRAAASALPDVFAELMRSIGIPRSLPQACEGVAVSELATQMKVAHNRGMADNAPCDVTDADLDAFAESLLSLPLLERAA